MAESDVLQKAQYIRAGGHPGRVDPRGSSVSRKRRKTKLLNDPAHGGTGTTVPCAHCGVKLDEKTVQQDRKKPGGSYAYHNIQPACATCNKRRSNNENWRYGADDKSSESDS